MKIIKEGVDPATQPMYATCSRCRTQIQFLPGEASYHSDQRDGDFYQIKCPVCPAMITKNIGTTARPYD